jgi:hypothetical protein
LITDIYISQERLSWLTFKNRNNLPIVNKHFVNYNNFIIYNGINIGQYLIFNKTTATTNTYDKLVSGQAQRYYELSSENVYYPITFEEPYRTNYNYNFWILNKNRLNVKFSVSNSTIINNKYIIKLYKTFNNENISNLLVSHRNEKDKNNISFGTFINTKSNCVFDYNESLLKKIYGSDNKVLLKYR